MTVVVIMGAAEVDCVTTACDTDGSAGAAKAGKGSGVADSGVVDVSSRVVTLVLLGREERLGASVVDLGLFLGFLLGILTDSVNSDK